VLVEESAIPATHMVIANHPPFANSNYPQIFKTIHEPPFINPLGERPVLSGNNFVVAFRGCQIARGRFEFFGERLVIEEYPRILYSTISSALILERGR
jgi:hypothetical protein